MILNTNSFVHVILPYVCSVHVQFTLLLEMFQFQITKIKIMFLFSEISFVYPSERINNPNKF